MASVGGTVRGDADSFQGRLVILATFHIRTFMLCSAIVCSQPTADIRPVRAQRQVRTDTVAQ